MKAKDLIDLLKSYPRDAEVLVMYPINDVLCLDSVESVATNSDHAVILMTKNVNFEKGLSVASDEEAEDTIVDNDKPNQ